MILPILPKPMMKRSTMLAVSIMVMLVHLGMMWALTYFDVLSDDDKSASKAIIPPVPIEIQLVSLSDNLEHANLTPESMPTSAQSSDDSNLLEDEPTVKALADKASESETFKPSLPSDTPSTAADTSSNTASQMTESTLDKSLAVDNKADVQTSSLAAQSNDAESAQVDEQAGLKTGADSKQKAAQNNVQTVLSVNSASANGETGSNGEAEQAQTAAQSLRQSNQQSQPLPFEREIIESQAFQATLLTTDSPDTPHNTNSNSNSNSNTESAIKLPSNKGQANNDKALDPGSSNRRQASSHQDNNGVSGSDSNTANRTNNTTKKNVSNIPASDGSKGNDSAISSGPVDFGEREAQWITKPNIDKELSKAIVATKTQGDVIVRLRIVVNIEGQPLTVSIISGLRNPRLANQLEQKIRKARLHPFRLGEQAVAGIVTVPMRFER